MAGAVRLSTRTTDAEPAAPALLTIVASLAACAVALLLSIQTVTPAAASGALPRWDLAAHLLNGWTLYDHLLSGRVFGFLWEAWTQSYWPPGQSLFQLPFYAAFGGSVSGGLHSSLAAFVLTVAGAVMLLGAIAGRLAWLPSAVVVGLMTTSPFFLAHATVAMSEMVGALAQVFVLVCYARYERTPTAQATRWLAGSLTVLFFTKYNYFILLAVPLACHVFLANTAGASWRARWHVARQTVAAWLTTAPGVVTAGYLFVVVAVLLAGGFSFWMAGRLVAFRTVGYSLHPVVYGWLVYLWITHRHGRSSLGPLAAHDVRLLPFLRWFVAPVVLWLASPFPNHIKDLVYLVVNVPMGPASPQFGLAAYLSAIRSDYFPHPVVCAGAVAAFVVALARHRSQPSLIRLLILTTLLQFAMVTVHHTRDARFVLLAMLPFWVVAAHEAGRWLAGRWTAAARLAAIGVLCAVVPLAHTVTAAEPFRRLAREHYVRSEALATALATVRGAIASARSVVVIGRRDALSPSLMKWQLGPPSGLPAFPSEVTREADLARIDAAEVVVVIEPSETSTANATARLLAQVASGSLVRRHDLPVADLGVTIRVFVRPGFG